MRRLMASLRFQRQDGPVHIRQSHAQHFELFIPPGHAADTFQILHPDMPGADSPINGAGEIKSGAFETFGGHGPMRISWCSII